MKDCTVYFSIPVSVDWNTALKHMAVLKDKCKITYWERGTKYNKSLIEDADYIVVILPNGKFTIECDELPIGVLNELSNPKVFSTPVFISYMNISHQCNIYESNYYNVDYNDNTCKIYGNFTGIGGTTSEIFYRMGEKQELLDSVGCTEHLTYWKVEDLKSFNKRNLLLLI